MYQKDYAVPNRFYGLVQRGNATALETYASNGFALLSGSRGTSGNVTASVRSTDGRTIIESRSGALGRFIVSVLDAIE